MENYPVFMRVAGWRCVVIGAGHAAEPRIVALAEAGALLTVIAPEVQPAVAHLATAGRLVHVGRKYQTGDLDSARLAYAAVGDDAIHAQIATDAAATGVLLNVVDRPQWCDFITPSIVRRGRLTLAISTGGASPALARQIRLDLENRFGPEYAIALEILARVRRVLSERKMTFADKQQRLSRLVAAPFIDHIRAGECDAVDTLLAMVAEGLSLGALGMAGLEVHHE